MEKKTAMNSRQISSRNRNKTKNKSMQTRVKAKEQAKKEKIQRINEKLDEALTSAVVNVSEKYVEKFARENVVIVPERSETARIKEIDDDNDDDDFISIEVNKFNYVDVPPVDNQKFRFVEEEDIVQEDRLDQEEELEEFQNKSLVKTEDNSNAHVDDSVKLDSEGEQNGVSENVETIPSDIPVATAPLDFEHLDKTIDNVDINAKKHVGFETRVVVLLAVIVVSFFIAGILIYNSLTSAKSSEVTYDETSRINYEVCVSQTGGFYGDTCLDEGKEYLSSITKRIPTTFNYQMKLSDELDDINIKYYVVAKVDIYKEKNGKSLNTYEDVLVERTDYDIVGNQAKITIDVDIPYQKYYEYVQDYEKQFKVNGYGEVKVSLYVDTGTLIKTASILTMPLSDNTYHIEKTTVNNSSQSFNVEMGEWSGINTSYSVVGLVFVFFGLMGIIKLTDLVCKVVSTGSLYQKKLEKIMREYDHLIVIARGDYTLDESKRLIKADSFYELLDARSTLEKPIVYVKVNNVKSEFYVEDSEIVYKYTMKEADFEEK